MEVRKFKRKARYRFGVVVPKGDEIGTARHFIPVLKIVSRHLEEMIGYVRDRHSNGKGEVGRCGVPKLRSRRQEKSECYLVESGIEPFPWNHRLTWKKGSRRSGQEGRYRVRSFL